MKITVFNDSEYILYVSLQQKEKIKIEPYNTIFIECENTEKIFIRVWRDATSYKEKNKYVLVLQTQYSIINYNAGDVIKITCEKRRIGISNVYYDWLLLYNETAICRMEQNNVLGAIEIKKKFRNSRIRYKLLISPLENMTGLVIASVLIDILLGWCFGWKISLISIPLLYIFVIFLDRVVDKIGNILFKKTLGIDNEETEFNSCFENEFICKELDNETLM